MSLGDEGGADSSQARRSKKRRARGGRSTRKMRKAKPALQKGFCLARSTLLFKEASSHKELMYIESILKKEIAKLKPQSFYLEFPKWG